MEPQVRATPLPLQPPTCAVHHLSPLGAAQRYLACSLQSPPSLTLKAHTVSGMMPRLRRADTGQLLEGGSVAALISAKHSARSQLECALRTTVCCMITCWGPHGRSPSSRNGEAACEAAKFCRARLEAGGDKLSGCVVLQRHVHCCVSGHGCQCGFRIGLHTLVLYSTQSSVAQALQCAGRSSLRGRALVHTSLWAGTKFWRRLYKDEKWRQTAPQDRAPGRRFLAGGLRGSGSWRGQQGHARDTFPSTRAYAALPCPEQLK